MPVKFTPCSVGTPVDSDDVLFQPRRIPGNRGLVVIISGRGPIVEKCAKIAAENSSPCVDAIGEPWILEQGRGACHLAVKILSPSLQIWENREWLIG